MSKKYENLKGFQIYADASIKDIESASNEALKISLSNGRSEIIKEKEFLNYINGTIPLI